MRANDGHHSHHRLRTVSPARPTTRPNHWFAGSCAGGIRPSAGVRRIAHVFPVSYEAVDRELPALIARERPDVLVMFGLALRTKHIRIETQARNSLTRMVVDVSGHRPIAGTIIPHAASVAAAHAGATAGHGGAIDRHGSRSRAMPDAISAIICAGGRPRHRSEPAGRGSRPSSTCP